MLSMHQYAQAFYYSLPRQVRHFVMIGGGCLRAYCDETPVKDIDCFFRCREDYNFTKGAMEQDSDFVSLNACERFCEFKHVPAGGVFNLVGFVFGSPREHLDRFDFRCSQFIAWYDQRGELQTDCAQGAYLDALNKHLYIQNNNGTERTLRRIRHYIEDYGYQLHPEQTVEQEDAFEDAFDGFDAHRPQGVHPTDYKEAPPLYMRIARRRVTALPVQHYPYIGE